MTIERSNQPCIFLLEEDDDTRLLLRQNLKHHGYRVLVALDEEDALQRLDEGNFTADIVLVDLVGKPVDEGLGIGRKIREQVGHDGRTPLVVIAEKYGSDVEGTDVNVGGNDWITYLGEPFQLEKLLARLIDDSSSNATKMDGTSEAKATQDRRSAQVTLYTRPGCHLCDEAKQAMLDARCEGQYALREINIDLDPELTRRYGWDIPVVLINGIETFRHRLTPPEFKRELRRAIDSANS